MRVSEAFGAAGITPAVTDAMFFLTCDECEARQRLHEMDRSEVGEVTIYACTSCGRSLVGVKPFKEDAEPRPDSGYRLTANVVGSKVDLFMRAKPDAASVLMPATPAFFE